MGEMVDILNFNSIDLLDSFVISYLFSELFYFLPVWIFNVFFIYDLTIFYLLPFISIAFLCDPVWLLTLNSTPSDSSLHCEFGLIFNENLLFLFLTGIGDLSSIDLNSASYYSETKSTSLLLFPFLFFLIFFFCSFDLSEV